MRTTATPSRTSSAAIDALRAMAFHHLERCSDAVTELYRERRRIAAHSQAADIWNVYDWLIAPLTLWPIDMAGLAKHIAGEIGARRALDPDLLLLLELLERAPPAETQQAITAYEKKVHAGEYDSLVKQPEKFTEQEVRLQRDETLSTFWSRIKDRFHVSRYEANKLHVIRRSMSQERNFRPHLAFRWNKRRDRFIQVFDALCHRWHLYGFQGDTPLLLKISVNPTPHGTMIVIPRHWSFDKARDLDWRAISDLHKAHGAARQGPKLSPSRIMRMTDAEAARHWAAEARRMGLRGERRYHFICAKMKRTPNADPAWLKRLLRQA